MLTLTLITVDPKQLLHPIRHFIRHPQKIWSSHNSFKNSNRFNVFRSFPPPTNPSKPSFFLNTFPLTSLCWPLILSPLIPHHPQSRSAIPRATSSHSVSHSIITTAIVFPHPLLCHHVSATFHFRTKWLQTNSAAALEQA
jgi:hypothetical protein